MVKNHCGKPLGAADCKGEFSRTSIAPVGDTLSQSAARPLNAMLVERDQRDAGWQCSQDQFALSSLQGRRWKRASLPHLDNCRARHDPTGEMRLQFLQRTAAKSANDEEAKTDQLVPGCHMPTASPSAQAVPHIFSRL